MPPRKDGRGRLKGRLSSPWLRAGAVFLVVLAADQLSKHAVRASIVPGEARRVLPGIQLVDTRNNGVAFGLFPHSQVVVAALIGLALLGLLVYFAKHTGRRLMWLPTGMLVGGALGNVLDRAREGSVTDFIKLPLGWPPFNLADSSIVVAILILLLLLERPRNSPAPGADES